MQVINGSQPPVKVLQKNKTMKQTELSLNMGKKMKELMGGWQPKFHDIAACLPNLPGHFLEDGNNKVTWEQG